MGARFDAYDLNDRCEYLYGDKQIGVVIEIPKNGTLMIYKGRNIFNQHILSPLAWPQAEYVISQDKHGYYLRLWDGHPHGDLNVIEPD